MHGEFVLAVVVLVLKLQLRFMEFAFCVSLEHEDVFEHHEILVI
jgi:hypothetical protein